MSVSLLEAAPKGRPSQHDILEGTVTLPSEAIVEAVAAMFAVGDVLERLGMSTEIAPLTDSIIREAEALRGAAWGSTADLNDFEHDRDPARLMTEIRGDDHASHLCRKLGLPVAAALYAKDASNRSDAGTMNVMSAFAGGYNDEATLQLITREYVEELDSIVEKIKSHLSVIEVAVRA